LINDFQGEYTHNTIMPRLIIKGEKESERLQREALRLLYKHKEYLEKITTYQITHRGRIPYWNQFEEIRFKFVDEGIRYGKEEDACYRVKYYIKKIKKLLKDKEYKSEKDYDKEVYKACGMPYTNTKAPSVLFIY
jgi:hypothetical protein